MKTVSFKTPRHAAANPRFRIKTPYELNDGYGSYVCEYGYKHDFGRTDFDPEAARREMRDPGNKLYTDINELFADLHTACESDDD